MKKLFLLLFLCALMGTLVSCHSSSGNEWGVSDVHSAQNTLEALDDYNAELLSSLKCSRGGGKKLYVASSDIIGAVSGINAGSKIAGIFGVATGGTGFAAIVVGAGLISGTAASYKAYRNSSTCAYPAQLSDDFLKHSTKMVYAKFLANSKKAENEPNVDEATGPVLNVETYERIDLPDDFSYLKTLGADHNAILKASNVDGNLPESPTACDVQELQIDKADFVKLQEAIGSENFQESYHEMLNEIPNGNYLESIDCSERVKLALEKYLELFQTYPKNVEELVEIANGYIQIIEDGQEFSKEEKELIYAGIMVSVYSPQLWDNFK